MENCTVQSTQNKMSDKAFIFDMDGVLIDSESAWVPRQDAFSSSLFGAEIYKKIGSTTGITVDTIYKAAQRHGFKLSKDRYYRIYDEQAAVIYAEAQPMANLTALLNYLRDNDFKIGLVSSSRMNWVKIVLKKLNIAPFFDVVLSLNDRSDLKPKPDADGYTYAMNAMNALASNTVILEDSNAGIKSAMASNAYTIAYKGLLPPGYKQATAHAQAGNVHEIIALLEEKFT